MTFLFQVQLRKDDCMISQVDERTSYLLSQCIFFRNGQRHSTDLQANSYCESIGVFSLSFHNVPDSIGKPETTARTRIDSSSAHLPHQNSKYQSIHQRRKEFPRRFILHMVTFITTQSLQAEVEKFHTKSIGAQFPNGFHV